VRRIAAIGILLVALTAIVWFMGPDRPAVQDSAAVVAQVRQLNQLATVKYTVQKIVGLREQKYPVGEESILLVIQASVDAGVDLAGLKERDIELLSDGSVVVRLPPARILNVAIDEKQTQVWDRSRTWWTPWVPYSKDLESRARQQGIEAARQAALDMGILRQADQNAESSIRTLLSLAGVKQVRVIPARVS
jgi:hypothetical protein